jgi:hypothetical protein
LFAIINALLGQLAVQPANGAPPDTTGEKRNHGRKAVRSTHATAASKTFSNAPARAPRGKAKTTK